MTVELRGRALLFDLDGTLVDSTALIFRAWSTWAVEFGVPVEAFAAVPLHGRPARDIVHDLVPGREAEALRRIMEIESSTPAGVTPIEGADELLRSLAAPEWAIVTSGSLLIAQPRLAALAVRPDIVVTADDVEHGKPDPEPYLLAAERLGIVPPSECIVFEDAPSGLAAATAAGMASVAVTSTHARDKLSATVVVDDLRAVSVARDARGLVVRVER